MIKALIFDFDGLNLDTKSPVYQDWEEIYQMCGCSTPLSEWLGCIGTANTFNPHNDLEHRLGCVVDRATIREQQDACKNDLAVMQTVRPGIEEQIAEAKGLGLKLGVASS